MSVEFRDSVIFTDEKPLQNYSNGTGKTRRARSKIVFCKKLFKSLLININIV